MTALAGGLPRMMRPTPHQNYPRGGYSLEGKRLPPVADKKLEKIQLLDNFWKSWQARVLKSFKSARKYKKNVITNWSLSKVLNVFYKTKEKLSRVMFTLVANILIVFIYLMLTCLRHWLGEILLTVVRKKIIISCQQQKCSNYFAIIRLHQF